MTLDINAPRDALTSHAQALGLFGQVLKREPISAPGSGLTYAVWVGALDPLPEASGLASTTVRVSFFGRLYLPADTEPMDGVDVQLTQAAGALMGAYSGDYTLGGSVRNIDLLGEFGEVMGARFGYLDIGSTTYRIATLTIPTVINDAFGQAA
ncbi:hypothetical protein ABZY90_19555 [Streptomyces sp. NPDC006422]|uniref:hypothetical protein n=1 Tax=unclassified Streptomyces TaxID=2593676 RepID=UPI0033AD5BFA